MEQTEKQKTNSRILIILFPLIIAVLGSGDWGFKAVVSGFMIFLSTWLFFIVMGKVEPYKSLLIMSPILGFLFSVTMFFMEQSYDFEKAIIAGFALFVTIWMLAFLLFVIVTIIKFIVYLLDKMRHLLIS